MPAHCAAGRRALDITLVVIFALASLYATARIGLGPRGQSGDGVGVIFAPWTSADDAMRRAVGAGARFVRPGGLPFIVIVMPEERDYPARIGMAGALLVIDARVVTACLQFFGGGPR